MRELAPRAAPAAIPDLSAQVIKPLFLNMNAHIVSDSCPLTQKNASKVAQPESGALKRRNIAILVTVC